jgi:hypothetical protein
MSQKNELYERGGGLKVKIRILFQGDDSWTQEIKLRTVKDNGYISKFKLNNCLFDEVFKCGNSVNFEIMLRQMLNHRV